ncbi:hypothetical protein [Sphingomonas sp. Marseille-Q8236]|jgi:hypothetical protein
MRHDPVPRSQVSPLALKHPVVRRIHGELVTEAALQARMLDDWLIGQLSPLG